MVATKDRAGSAQDTARTRVGTVGAVQQSAPSTQERQKALIRQLKAEYGIEVTEQMQNAIGKLFENMIGQENAAQTLILNLAQAQVTKRQDLQSKQAEMMMNILAQPENTKAHIASLATGFATILRLFDANEAADYVEAKAKDIMSTVKITLNADGIENGAGTMTGAINGVLRNMQGASSARGAAAGAQGVTRDLDTLVPPVHTQQGDSAPAAAAPARRSVSSATWEQLYAGAREVGLDDKGIAALKRSFDASKDVSVANGKLDNGSERLQMFAQASREITAKDKEKVQQLLNNVMGPIESLATQGPRGG